MQAIIIYYSFTGNTAQAAKYIKKGLEDENVVVTSRNVHKIHPEDLSNKDLIVFGTPNHVINPLSSLFNTNN
ncbi:MAG: flavodoxin family protein [Candidatus Helarchaeota archaeon]